MSVRIGSLAMLICAVVIVVIFSDRKDNTAKMTAAQTNEVSDVASNGPIVFTNLQVVPSFGQ